jgi:hypothetical protein
MVQSPPPGISFILSAFQILSVSAFSLIDDSPSKIQNHHSSIVNQKAQDWMDDSRMMIVDR